MSRKFLLRWKAIVATKKLRKEKDPTAIYHESVYEGQGKKSSFQELVAKFKEIANYSKRNIRAFKKSG